MASSDSTSNSEVNAPEIDGSPAPTRQRRRRRSRWRWLRWLRSINYTRIFIVLVVAVTLVAVIGSVLVTDAANRVEGSLSSLERVLSVVVGKPGTQLTLSDLDRLRASLKDVVSTLNSVQSQARLIAPLFAVNETLETNVLILEAAQLLARAGDELLNGAQPVLALLLGSSSEDPISAQLSSGERIIELLQLGRPSFLNAETHLQTADQVITQLDTRTLSINLRLQLDQLRQYHDQLTAMQSVLLLSPELLTTALGVEDELSYLVLAQNNDEIRPSGGYLGTYGWLLVRSGQIEDYNYSATTATSPNPPSEMLSDQIHVPNWWIQYDEPIYAAWDGSWSPDFPTTGEMALWYYNQGNNPPFAVSGAISIDLVGFEYLLQALGSVMVSEYGVVVNAINFRQAVYAIRESGDHKAFLAALYRQIFQDWQTQAADRETGLEITGALLKALQEKHVMLYFADADLQRAIQLLGWAGEQAAAVGRDYLMVVDANLGNKSNASIRRQLIYDVELWADRSVTSRATVLYDYAARTAALDPAVNAAYHGPLDYNNLLQVYVPEASQLLDTVGDLYGLETVSSPTSTLFVAELTVPYDSRQRYQFSYSSSDVVQAVGDFGHYVLLIQKQPGMRSESVSVQITLPLDATLISTSPSVTSTYTIERQILEFRFDLVSDVQIEIIYQLP